MNKGDKIIYINRVLGSRVRRFVIPRYYNAVVTWWYPEIDCFGIKILNGAKDGIKHGSEFDAVYKVDKGETWDTPEDFKPISDAEEARLLEEFEERRSTVEIESAAILDEYNKEIADEKNNEDTNS